jgi:hypothetical protein
MYRMLRFWAAAVAALSLCLIPAAAAQDSKTSAPKSPAKTSSSGPGSAFGMPSRVKGGPVKYLPGGKPDLQGVWGPLNGSAAYDIEGHPAQFGIAGGKSVIINPPDGKIPYQPWAAERKKELAAKHMYNDPEAHCMLSGVPRQNYAPFGYQILQPPGYVVFLYEYIHAYRIIPLDGRPHAPANIKMFEGDSRGHWEGKTLVVDVTNLNDITWFDMAGNFHSDQIHVVERYTPIDSNTIHYEATITDPKVYTRPWTMAFDIGRNLEPGYEQLEFACHEGEQDLKHYTEKEGGKK